MSSAREMSFLSVAAPHTAEKIIERSRFLTYAAHTAGEEEARAFLTRVRSEHPLATHVCYAFVADRPGNLMRFSDDGEPQGTAGMPILEVIKSKGLYETAVVVTRYFGGIKLGAGGLVRAYSGSVAENLAKAVRVSYQPCAESQYIVDYPYIDAVNRFFGENDCMIIGVSYADRVIFSVAVKKEAEQAFDSALVNRLNGRVNIVKKREYLYPFSL